MASPQVRVGVGAFLLSSSQETSSNPRFLIGKRKNAHGAGTWALPGGHLEFGETFQECAAREVLEETGLRVDVEKIRFLTATNDVMGSEGKHYVTIFMVCERSEEDEGVDARVMEPEKCEGWEWVSWEELVGWIEKTAGEEERKVFLPLVSLVRQRPGVVPASRAIN